MGTHASIGVYAPQYKGYITRTTIFDGSLDGKGIALAQRFTTYTEARALVEDDAVWRSFIGDYEAKYNTAGWRIEREAPEFFFRWDRWWHTPLDLGTTNSHDAIMPLRLHFALCKSIPWDDPEWVRRIGQIEDLLAPAVSPDETPMPTPGPSSVVAQAAGEGGGLRERLARLVADGLPVTLAYHPDADPGDGSGWSVEVGDRHAYGQLEDALTRATGPFSVWNESKSMDLGEG